MGKSQGRRDYTREERVRAALPLVHYAVAEIAHRVPPHVGRDELLSAAMYGLAQASETFDETRSVSFEHYASIRINGALLDELRSRDWASRSVRTRANELRSQSESLRASLGREPRSAEVARSMGLSEQELHAIQDDVHRATVLHYDSVFTDGSAEETLGTPSDSPEDHLLQRERLAYLFDAVDALPERLRHVVIGYFFEDCPMEELAEELGVTESRISQLRAEAVERIREALDSQLEPETFASREQPTGVIARRRSAYYADVAAASDARARLSIDLTAQRAQMSRFPARAAHSA